LLEVGIGAVRADPAIKVFGDDLDTLLVTANEILAGVQQVEGAADASVEQVGGLLMLAVVPEREALARYGLNVEDLQGLVATGIGDPADEDRHNAAGTTQRT